MYHYIVDQSRIPVRNFDRLLGEVYGHLTEYQINGEVHRVTRLRNLPELAAEALRTGARTVIAVGDDQTFLQLVEVLADQDVVLGFIPLADSRIADILHLRGLSEACTAIAQRRIDQFDLGRVGRNNFFTQIDFGWVDQILPVGKKPSFFNSFVLSQKIGGSAPFGVKIWLDGKITLEAQIIGGSIINARDDNACNSPLGSAKDGQLDLVLLGKLTAKAARQHLGDLAAGCLEELPGVTILHGRKFEIETLKPLELRVGGVPAGQAPLTVSVSDQKLKLIIGRGR